MKVFCRTDGKVMEQKRLAQIGSNGSAITFVCPICHIEVDIHLKQRKLIQIGIDNL